MFTDQDKGLKDLEPCLLTLEKINLQNSNLLKPIEQLTDDVSNNICNIFITKFNF